MKHTDRLYYCPLGTHEMISPRANETLAQAFKRLHRLARSYAEQGRYFRVEQRPDGILWWRVTERRNSILARWFALPPGATHTLKQGASAADLQAAKATARYLRRKGEGRYRASLVDGCLVVERLPNVPDVPRQQA